MARLFADHGIDAMLAPTLPTAAIDADRLVIEGTGLDESVGVAWTRLTMPFNATGQPVLAIPCGLDSEGLPVGIQLAGIPGQEAALFETALLVERALDFHRSHTPLARAETGAVSDRGNSMMSTPDGIAARGAQARNNLVVALRECCELADAVESLEGQELLEVLVYLDSLRFVMAESGQLLQGVVRGFGDAEPV